MGFRSLVLLSVVVSAFSLAPSARAGTGGSTSSSTTATGAGGATTTGGGGAPGAGATCTVEQEMIAGTTCQECSGSACTALGDTYSFVCQHTASVAVWCNGPVRTLPSDQNVASCSVAAPGGALSGLAACAVAAAAALSMRRRRR
jgi:hypothetical protein